MIIGVTAVVVVALVVALVVMIARDPGPPPTEVALGYETAWDRLDFDGLWRLSGPELRDGLDRAGFVAAKCAAYAGRRELRHLVTQTSVEAVQVVGDEATVTTRLCLADGGEVRNELRLVRRDGGWQVVAYALRPAPA